MLIPAKKVTLDTNNKIITIEDLLEDDFIETFEILNNPIRLKGTFGISQEDFRDILYTVMTMYNIEEFKHVETTLHDNYIKIKFPIRVLNFIYNKNKFIKVFKLNKFFKHINNK